MKIMQLVQKIHQTLFVRNTLSIHLPDAMDLATQRVTQKQQMRSQILLFKTDYLE